jgi:hypothetical protein
LPRLNKAGQASRQVFLDLLELFPGDLAPGIALLEDFERVTSLAAARALARVPRQGDDAPDDQSDNNDPHDDQPTSEKHEWPHHFIDSPFTHLTGGIFQPPGIISPLSMLQQLGHINKPGAEVPGAVTAGRAERILFIYFSQWALSPYVVFSRFFWFILPKKSLLAIFLKTPPGTLYSMQKKLRSGINPPAIEAWHTETLRLNEEKIKTLVKCQRCGYNYT